VISGNGYCSGGVNWHSTVQLRPLSDMVKTSNTPASVKGLNTASKEFTKLSEHESEITGNKEVNTFGSK
jgi:hypothetical protein